MKPDTTQIIKGIKRTVEDHVMPRMESKREQGMVRSVLCLLDHVVVRVEHEGQVLTDDIRDVRALFSELDAMLSAAPGNAELKGALVMLKEKAGPEYRPAGAYPTIASLTEESNDLKHTLTLFIETLNANKSEMPKETFDKTEQAIQQALARLMEREGLLIQPFIGKRVY